MSLVTVYIRRTFGCLVWVCFIAKKSQISRTAKQKFQMTDNLLQMHVVDIKCLQKTYNPSLRYLKRLQ